MSTKLKEGHAFYSYEATFFPFDKAGKQLPGTLDLRVVWPSSRELGLGETLKPEDNKIRVQIAAYTIPWANRRYHETFDYDPADYTPEQVIDNMIIYLTMRYAEIDWKKK